MNDQESHLPPNKIWTVRVAYLVLIIAAFALGYVLSARKDVPEMNTGSPTHTEEGHDHSDAKPKPEAKKDTIWTCSMHPQIKLPKPGKCPICFMDLIPLESDKSEESAADPRMLTLSETAKRLAQVESETVDRAPAKVVVRMFGMVFEDETRIASLTSRVDGRLDEIYVNFTGDRVKQGDPMVKIWSPTLIKSQVELFESMNVTEPDPEVTMGAEEKLMQQGLTRDQIGEIRAKQKPILYVTLRAPISGIVMKRMAVLGQFVKEGTEMYSINDLSHVWIKMDAYETDIPWIRYGQDVTFTTPAVPGRKFMGKVLFIDPMLDEKTRSVKVRVEADNPDFILKPGMFVSAELEAEVDSQGRVIKSEWAGKYICPMHPSDEPSSTPGTCPESNMALRPASAYGYADTDKPELPLIVPATAPLITGKRAIVYVEVPKADRPTFELREIVLGPRTGKEYVVYDGLKQGERVVTRGNFKIDSAMQILARPSMMAPPVKKKAEAEAQPREQPEEEAVEKVEAPREFLEGLTPVIEEYLALKDALVEEDVAGAGKHAGKLNELLKEVKTNLLKEEALGTWKELNETVGENLAGIVKTEEVAAQRKAFGPVSEAFARVVMGFRHVMGKPVVLFHCPMAFGGQGAYWLEGSEERRNPYFGRKPSQGQVMLQCGELIDKIPPEAKTAEADKGSGRSASSEKETGKFAQSNDKKVSAPQPSPQGHDGDHPSEDKGGAK